MWNVGTFLFDFCWLHSICRTGCVFRAGVSEFRVISTKCEGKKCVWAGQRCVLSPGVLQTPADTRLQTLFPILSSVDGYQPSSGLSCDKLLSDHRSVFIIYKKIKPVYQIDGKVGKSNLFCFFALLAIYHLNARIAARIFLIKILIFDTGVLWIPQ